jgi:hypothetical protein
MAPIEGEAHAREAKKLEGYTGYVEALRRASIDVAANIAANLGP